MIPNAAVDPLHDLRMGESIAFGAPGIPPTWSSSDKDFVTTALGIPFIIASFYGGTGLLIVVSVCWIWCRKSTVT